MRNRCSRRKKAVQDKTSLRSHNLFYVSYNRNKINSQKNVERRKFKVFKTIF